MRLHDLAASSSPWTRTTAAAVLDNWTSQIGDHSQFIRRVAPLNRSVVTLRTGNTVHTGHLTGLLGGNYIADVILDLVGGLINASPDHSTLLLPLVLFLMAGRPMTILLALRDAATSVAVLGSHQDPILSGQFGRPAR